MAISWRRPSAILTLHHSSRNRRGGSLSGENARSRFPSIETSYETGGLRIDMARLYGFDGSKAPANTLGVSAPMRSYAYARLEECGLKTPL